MVGDGPVRFSCLVDINFHHLGLLLLLCNISRHRLRGRNRRDQGVIRQHIAFARSQQPQNLILNPLQLCIHLRILHHHLVLLLFQIRALPGHGDSKHLVFQSLRGDGEVEQRNFHGGLGGVVRVRQGRSHEETERLDVGHGLVAEANDVPAAVLDLLLQKHRLQRGIKLSPDVLAENPPATLNSNFKCPQKIGFREFRNVKASGIG
mmetsp:Transcript_1222/g.3003  ORF Transcript_1222/g.3003 Transcript_1222/m.3003 type:complete len:206 (+) Transcript_1222:2522-3139(+)